jgi:16S rRNA (adenine1518-N6/adenine1519-N6)-dimethyltransferase
MGMLTKYLLAKPEYETWVCEIDRESVAYLEEHYPELNGRIISKDFLRYDLDEQFKEQVAIIGNFPYNISSQILFKAVEHKEIVPEVVGMFQKEMAQRLAAKEGNKTYGVISVLIQAWYKIEYLFTVSEHVFSPPPKVKSAVIRLTRNDTKALGCDEKLFVEVVKAAFNQRRKTVKNALHAFEIIPGNEGHIYFTKRAEQLTIEDFVQLTLLVRKP